MILGIPDDIDPSTLPSDVPMRKVKIIQKHVKKSRMLLNRSGIINVIEEEAPPPPPKVDDKDPFNISSDEHYVAKTQESLIKVATGESIEFLLSALFCSKFRTASGTNLHIRLELRSSIAFHVFMQWLYPSRMYHVLKPSTHSHVCVVVGGTLLQHATPVVELQTPFVATHIGPIKLRQFHRWPLKRFSHGPLANYTLFYGVLNLQRHILKKAKVILFALMTLFDYLRSNVHYYIYVETRGKLDDFLY